MSVLKTYTITGSSFTGTLVFKYDVNGVLANFDLDGELSDKQRAWLFSHRFPFQESGIKMFSGIVNFTVFGGNLDLSFDNFWNAYNYKIGKKPMAENIWKRMSKADQIAALSGIKPYDSHLARHIMKAKAHATTYLNQRYWENDFGKY